MSIAEFHAKLGNRGSVKQSDLRNINSEGSTGRGPSEPQTEWQGSVSDKTNYKTMKEKK